MTVGSAGTTCRRCGSSPPTHIQVLPSTGHWCSRDLGKAVGMADDPRLELREAGDEYKAVRTSLAQVRAAIEPVIVEALCAGVPQKDVVELFGFTRETIRTMARNNGIEPR